MVGILIVDPQYDFFPGGSLGVKDGNEIIAPINTLLKSHPSARVFITRDWHPKASKHFKSGGGIWVAHCLQQTRGAMFHEDIDFPSEAFVYSKGTNPEDDGGYSGFEGFSEKGKTLLEDLKAQKIDEVIVCGLATDYCVKATVLDALEAGLKVQLFAEGMRAVNVNEGDGRGAFQSMLNAGAKEYRARDLQRS